MDDVKTTYRSQLKKKMEDTAEDKRILSDTYKNENEKQKSISENQKRQLVEKQQAEISQRDEKLNELHRTNQSKLQESVQNHSQKLKSAHEKEVHVLVKDKTDLAVRKERDKDELSKYYKGEIDRQKSERERETGSWRSKYYDTVTNLNDKHTEDIGVKSQILENEVKLVKNRYQDKLDDVTRKMTGANEDLKATVEDRINGQINSKQSKIQNLETKLSSAMTNDSRLRSIERKNLEAAFQSQVGILEEQRDGQRQALKELNEKHIDKANQKNNAILRDVQRRHKTDMNLKTEQYRQSIDGEKELNKNHLDRVIGQTERQNQKITQISREREKELNNYFEQSIDQAKDNFVDRVIVQREKNDENFAKLNVDMNQKFRNIENKFTEKLDKTIHQYEAKINELAEKNKSDMKHLEQTYQGRMENQGKAHKMEKSSQEMKYEAKLASQREQQDQQLQKMDERHQQELKTLASRMNSYNRKA